MLVLYNERGKDMYTIVKSVIETRRYELMDVLSKIDVLWLQGDFTDAQRTELVELARSNADPEASYAPLQAQVDALAGRVDALAARVAALEAGGTEGDTPATPVDEWPEYVQPTGAHDAYNAGDKITYNGQHYICQMDGCVWPRMLTRRAGNYRTTFSFPINL